MDKTEFEKLYKICFDENENIKACGRENCKKLIKYLGGEPYGNPDTGVMNTKNIIKLHRNIMKTN